MIATSTNRTTAGLITDLAPLSIHARPARFTNVTFGDGQSLSGTGSNCVDANPLHFTGQQWDSESGLHYFRARHYSTQFGRFMSPDPTGTFLGNLNDPQSLNLYAYVRNNSPSRTDPSGLCDDFVSTGTCVDISIGLGGGWGGGGNWDWGGGPDGPLNIPANIGRNPNPAGAFGGGVWWSQCGFLYSMCGLNSGGTSGSITDSPFIFSLEGAGCPAVPEHPADASLAENIRAASRSVWMIGALLRLTWFYQHVRNGGPWDYKQQGKTIDDFGGLQPSPYQDFGNFNFGAAGAAAGIQKQVLLRTAGWAQTRAGTSVPAWGHWYDLHGPYGDDPKDQALIMAGYAYYKNGCY